MHQPNFFPWYPYFHRMNQADRFVIVSHCQFENYLFQKRFHLNNKWFSMPISDRKKLESIMNKKYVDYQKNWAALKRKLPEYEDILNLFDQDIGQSLFTTNIRIIQRIRDILGIKTELVYDYFTKLTSTDRILDLMAHYGGSTFLAGPSAVNYMNFHQFDLAGIRVNFHKMDDDLKIPILPVLRGKLG